LQCCLSVCEMWKYQFCLLPNCDLHCLMAFLWTGCLLCSAQVQHEHMQSYAKLTEFLLSVAHLFQSSWTSSESKLVLCAVDFCRDVIETKRSRPGQNPWDWCRNLKIKSEPCNRGRGQRLRYQKHIVSHFLFFFGGGVAYRNVIIIIIIYINDNNTVFVQCLKVLEYRGLEVYIQNC